MNKPTALDFISGIRLFRFNIQNGNIIITQEIRQDMLLFTYKAAYFPLRNVPESGHHKNFKPILFGLGYVLV